LAKAYLTPYGVGLGHASRLMLVADRLKNCNTIVKFSSYGEAARYISMYGYKCLTVPPVEFSWSLGGDFSIKYSIANIPRWFTNFSIQVNKEIQSMIGYNPDIIISDTRLSSILAAKVLGISSVVILNQAKLLLSPRLHEFKIARLFEKINGELLGSLWSMSDKILIPDLPPPYTIASHNIWDVSSIVKKIQYVGFMAPELHVDQAQINKVAQYLSLDRSRPIIFIHISGPMQTRMTIIKIIVEACKCLSREIQYIVSEGRPTGSTQPKKLAGSGWYYEWCPVRDEILAMSNLLIIRGGHVAISQAIQFGKPMISIPIENHGEQLGNSAKIAKIGVGIMLQTKQLNTKVIIDAIYQILNHSIYQDKANEIMKLTDKLNGIDNVIKTILSSLSKDM
jgi:UDP-N-acetylglucosamine--N-acetylmuramyl-(pentapeptide) pyrophosphoryl-undecaprenol N-acetylglucosamine transferase